MSVPNRSGRVLIAIPLADIIDRCHIFLMLGQAKNRHTLIVMLAFAFGAAVIIPSAISAVITVLSVLGILF